MMTDPDLPARLWSLAAPLFGALIGGLISALTTRSLDRSRWRHDRQEKLAAQKRDALAAALEWIEPMRNAQIQASSLLTAAIHGGVAQEEMLQRWPYVLADLKKRELPGHQRAVLPADIYPRGHRIVFALDELRGEAVRYSQEVAMRGNTFQALQASGPKIHEVDEAITQLENDLRAAYLKSFE